MTSQPQPALAVPPRVSNGGDVAAFRLGEQSAFEPPPDFTGPDSETVTTKDSWWNHLICSTCGHTFRRGDRVRHDPGSASVVHLDPALGCAGAATPRPTAGVMLDTGVPPAIDDAAQFADGLAMTWPPAGKVPVTRLGDGDWRTTRPRPPLERDRCLYCAHTFRDGEHVVICPCSPGDPACGAAVHRDPAAGLVCWESWQPDGQVRQCPVSAARPGEARR
jgi:hypothetical protein